MSTTNPTSTSTEWDDLQRKYGNYAPIEKEITNEEITRKNIGVIESTYPLETLSQKHLSQLEEKDSLNCQLEDELLAFRQKRLNELKERQKYDRYGVLTHVNSTEFLKEVTEASKQTIGNSSSKIEGNTRDDRRSHMEDAAQSTEAKAGTWVFVHVYHDSHDFCQKFNDVLKTFARRFPFIKFVKGFGKDIIPGFPEEKLPIVLLYWNGECCKQIYGSGEWGNMNVNEEIVEYILGNNYNMLDTDIEEDPRSALSKNRRSEFNQRMSYRNGDVDVRLRSQRPIRDNSDSEEEVFRDDRNYSSLNMDNRGKWNL